MESLEDRTPTWPRRSDKVALVGFADSWKEAPWQDESIEIWSLNEFWKYASRWDRWFEVHDEETLGITTRDLSEGEQKRHLEWLRAQPPGKPIYMLPQHCGGEFPAAVPLPLDVLTKRFKAGRYFTSTIAYMIALAIHEGYPWIGLYGIDLASDIEYQDQRPCGEYLLGVAEGLGIQMELAPTCAMLKVGHLYGFEKPVGSSLKDAIATHMKGLREKHEQSLATLNTLDGAIQECENLLKLTQYKERGAHVPTY
jgi:hypothetical protein